MEIKIQTWTNLCQLFVRNKLSVTVKVYISPLLIISKSKGFHKRDVTPMDFVYILVITVYSATVMHIYVSKLTTIGSDNGLSPCRRQASIWTNAGIMLIGPIGTNFSEIQIKINTFSFKKMHLKMLFAKWQPFCPGLNVLNSDLYSPSLTAVLYAIQGWF